MPYTRKIILGVSDLHSGFTLGLCNPETVLQDENANDYHPAMTETQKFLWNVYTNGIEETKHLAGKDEILAFSLGDVTHGNKYVGQQMTTRISDQTTIAYWNFLPIAQMKNVKTIRLAIGTDAHEFAEGSASSIVASTLREKTKKNIRTVYHGNIRFGGIDIDYSHHGPGTGNKNWTHGNEAKSYLRSKMLNDLDAGEKPADLVVRGHYHNYVREWCGISRGGKEYEAWIVIMPSLCGLGSIGAQLTKSVYRLSPGVVVWEIINGKISQTLKFGETLDIRCREEV